MCCREVKEETEDRIVLVDDVENEVLGVLLIIAIGLFMIWCGISLFRDFDGGLLHTIIWLFFDLLCILFGGFCILFGLWYLLINKSVIIDKRLQSVIIEEHFFRKFLKSTKKIPFSLIKEVGLICDTGCYEDHDSQAKDLEDSWELFLITIHEDSIPIYCGDESSLKLEKIAKKKIVK